MDVDLPEVVAEVRAGLRALRAGARQQRRGDARRAVPPRRAHHPLRHRARTSTATRRSPRSAPGARRSASCARRSRTVITTYGRDYARRLHAVSSPDAGRQGRPPDADLGAFPGRLARGRRARQHHRCAAARPDAHGTAPEPTSPIDIGGLHAAYARRARSRARSSIACSRRSTAAADPGIFISLADRKERAQGGAEARPLRSDGQAAVGHPLRRQGQHRRRGPADHGRLSGLRLHAQGQRAPRSSALLAAGALLIGKTNLDQFATGLVGVRTPYPVPQERLRSRPSCRADRARARPSRWRWAWCRSRSAPTRRARAACRRASTTSSASSRRWARCRPGAWCRPAARSIASPCSPAPSTTPGPSTR